MRYRQRFHLWKKITRQVFLTTIIFIILFMGLEVTAQHILPSPDYYQEDIYQYDPVLGHSFKKNFTIQFAALFKTNAQGWRDKEFTLEKKPEKKRIVFLGDSFLESVYTSSENTLPHIVEKDLENRGFNCESYNFGLGDIGQNEEYLIWKNHAKKYKPDIVVLQVFPLNDIVNNSLYYAERNSSYGDWLRPYISFEKDIEKIHYKHPLLALVRKNSILFRIFEVNILSHYRKPPQQKPQPGEPGCVETMIYLDNTPTKWKEAICHTQNLILKIKTDVEKTGAKFYIVVIPYETALQTQTKKTIADYEKPEKDFTKFFTKNKINGLCALYPLRAYLKSTKLLPESIFPEKTGHLNAQGLRITGKALAEFIYNTPAHSTK